MSATGVTAALLAFGLAVAPMPAGAATVASTSTTGVSIPIAVPLHISVNVCGNTVNVIAILSPAFGNHCVGVNA